MHQSILDAVNQQLNYAVHWKAWGTEGTSNSLYQGSNHQHVLVLRINAPESLAFGVSREQEAIILNAIQAYPWGLRVELNNPKQGWCVMRHHGMSLEGSDLTPLMKRQLLLAVSDYQQMGLDSNLSHTNYNALFSLYRKQLSTLTESSFWLEQLDQLEQGLQQLPVVPFCLTHHDLHLGNLCWQDNQIHLIDWEYARIGNPWFDAFALFKYCHITVDEIKKLPAWSHLSNVAFNQGLSQAERLSQRLEALWYKVRC